MDNDSWSMNPPQFLTAKIIKVVRMYVLKFNRPKLNRFTLTQTLSPKVEHNSNINY